MEPPVCEQRIAKVSLAELLRCFEHAISEEQAWAICFQCCRKIEQLIQGLCPSLHSVFIKGSGSIFIHADGTASFKVYHKSDAGSIQQSEDKLLEYLGVVIYEALDWGIDSQAERELSDPLEKLLCLMLKLDDEATKPAVTLQDVIKVSFFPLSKHSSFRGVDGTMLLTKRQDHYWACEEHLARPSEATRHYEMTCRSLFTEYTELQKLMTIIQTSKERLRKMDVEDWLENSIKKKKTCDASPWPDVICELQAGVRLRKAAERPWHCVSPKERVRSPYELLLDDIRQKRYTLRKVTIKQKHRALKVDVAALKPHLKPVGDLVLHLIMAKQEILVASNTALNSPSNNFLHLQDASTEFKITITKTQQLGAGAQDCPFPMKWPSPTIAELIGTRYAMMVLEEQGLFQGGSDGVFPRAKVCDMDLKVPILAQT
ncbi:protein spire 1-like protein [Turdus rufiventris]|nr:protein spire 1-like protein [Turdus rufiventris]